MLVTTPRASGGRVCVVTSTSANLRSTQSSVLLSQVNRVGTVERGVQGMLACIMQRADRQCSRKSVLCRPHSVSYYAQLMLLYLNGAFCCVNSALVMLAIPTQPTRSAHRSMTTWQLSPAAEHDCALLIRHVAARRTTLTTFPSPLLSALNTSAGFSPIRVLRTIWSHIQLDSSA